MWHVTNEKNGVSAMSLQRVLGLKSYQTAWTWLHKIRRAMIRPGRDRLSGVVEIDETFVGGEEIAVRVRQTETKSLVVIVAQVDGNGIGRIRMRCIPDASSESLLPFIENVIEPGSIVRTDGWSGYARLSNLGYRHEMKVLRGKGKSTSTELLPRVHQVSSLLKGGS